MGKFRRLFELLLESALVGPEHVHQPEPAERAWLELAHTPQYVEGVFSQSLDEASVRRIGLPMGETVVRRSRAAVGGTVLAARLALAHGIACNTAGGSHHAHSDHGAGYCVFNDVVVAGRALLAEGAIRRVLVIDLDVHQGDGTAAMCAGDPRLFTFSMHCERNFPAAKAVSDRDVALPAGLDDAGYLEILDRELRALLPRVDPDLVFYNAGVDPHAEDRLGRLALTDAGLAARERTVLGACRARGVPVAGVLGGGYTRDLDALVARHALLFHAAQAMLAD